MAGWNGSGGGRNGNGGTNGGGRSEDGAIPRGTMAMLERHGPAMLRQLAGGRPRILELQVTRGCNARCAWCDAWRAPGSDAGMPDYAPLVRRLQPLDVALVGGEPLLRPDLERVAASIRLGTEISSLILVTNGVDLSLERAHRLREAGVDKLVVLLEGLGEENDRTRRRPGLSAHIDGLLPGLVAAGFRAVQLQVVITGRSPEGLVEAARYARERGVRVSFTVERPARLEARAISVDESALAALADAMEQLAVLAETWPHIASSPEYLRRVVPFLREQTADFPDCAAGSGFLRVTPDGWIRPCADVPPLGHWTAWPLRPTPFDCPGCWTRLRGDGPSALGVRRLVELYRASTGAAG
ncbi:MAG: radical SAM protein [Deltaproteobacteria bacterium]|nr:radical SAM protein [Deltaproteobacteria bacterium]